MDKNCSC